MSQNVTFYHLQMAPFLYILTIDTTQYSGALFILTLYSVIQFEIAALFICFLCRFNPETHLVTLYICLDRMNPLKCGKMPFLEVV